jgi:BirA family biotin operon repressor/biotin-[acetyl-CoA-carboxylase] ligase
MERYIFLAETDSTNTYAKSLWAGGGVGGQGEPDSADGTISDDGPVEFVPANDFLGDTLTVIRAGRQKHGRGRDGNDFFSYMEGGLWVSVIAPVTDISAHFEHNRAISLAILETLKLHAGGAKISIKWPNDIYWGDKKIAGVLLENVPGNSDVLIIGFGVNINVDINRFPKDLRDSVTSVQSETGGALFLDSTLDGIIEMYRKFIDSGQAAVHQLYLENLYKLGHRANVGKHTGKFVTVEPDGRLRLETEHGGELCSSGTLRFLGDDE